MGDGVGKTVIFAGGLMDDRHYDNFNLAKGAYPKDALITAQFPKPVDGVFSLSPASKDGFISKTSALIRGSMSSGSLDYVQFGHGGDGPSLLLPDGYVGGEEFIKLFEENLDPAKHPTISIVLGGCYSGGFGKLFLKSKISPDFFFGASPPFAYAFNGLPNFFTNSGDSNGDGVITYRERAVYEMNHDNPLAVMFSLRGSPDVDLAGRPAVKPYFPKEVEPVDSHTDLIKKIEGLKFGEQAVVLVERDGSSPVLKNWCEKEALGGDGYYKFFIVKDNPESRKFFNAETESKIFVMGPNLRYRGVPLTSTSPIGDQIPPILAQENPLMIMAGWKGKIKREISSPDYTINSYLESIKENSDFDFNSLISQTNTLLQSEKEEDQTEGLKLANIIFDSEIPQGDVIKFYRPLVALAYKVRSELFHRQKPSFDRMANLVRAIDYLDDKLDAAGEEIGEPGERQQLKAYNQIIFYYGLKFYGVNFNDSHRNFRKIPNVKDLLKEDIHDPDPAIKVGALKALIALKAGFYDEETDYIIKELLKDESPVEVRRTVAQDFFDYMSDITFSKSQLEWIAHRFFEETDVEIRKLLYGFVHNWSCFYDVINERLGGNDVPVMLNTIKILKESDFIDLESYNIIYKLLDILSSDESPTELKLAAIEFLQGVHEKDPNLIGYANYEWLAYKFRYETDPNIKSIILDIVVSKFEDSECIRNLGPEVSKIFQESEPGKLKDAAERFLKLYADYEAAHREEINQKIFDAQSRTFLYGSLFGANVSTKYDNSWGIWNAGLGVLWRKGVWIDDGGNKTFSLGVRPELYFVALVPSVESEEVGNLLIGSVGAVADFGLDGASKHIIVSAGPTLQSDENISWAEIGRGWTGSVGIFGEGEFQGLTDRGLYGLDLSASHANDDWTLSLKFVFGISPFGSE